MLISTGTGEISRPQVLSPRHQVPSFSIKSCISLRSRHPLLYIHSITLPNYVASRREISSCFSHGHVLHSRQEGPIVPSSVSVCMLGLVAKGINKEGIELRNTHTPYTVELMLKGETCVRLISRRSDTFGPPERMSDMHSHLQSINFCWELLLSCATSQTQHIDERPVVQVTRHFPSQFHHPHILPSGSTLLDNSFLLSL